MIKLKKCRRSTVIVPQYRKQQVTRFLKKISKHKCWLILYFIKKQQNILPLYEFIKNNIDLTSAICYNIYCIKVMLR